MPLRATATGFDLTYSRGRCLVFATIMLPFAVLMLLAGLNEFVPILEQTPLHWLRIERSPTPVYASIAILGALVLGYVVIRNSFRAIGNDLAIRVNHAAVESRTIVGARSIAWQDVASVTSHKSTIFLHPAKESGIKTVPLNVHLTGIKPDELRAELLRYRPDLFNDL